VNAHLTHSSTTVLELTVSDHPSVLARLTSLCSRRAYTIGAMLYPPAARLPERQLWLLVHSNCAAEQIAQQLLKLEDVRAVRHHGPEHPLLQLAAEQVDHAE